MYIRNGFAGGQHTAHSLVHFGERYLDIETGRWTQPDPLDQTGDLREGNRYAYVGANPVNYIDPSGLSLLDDVGDVAKEGLANGVMGAVGGAIAGVPAGPAGMAAGAAVPRQDSLHTR